MTKTKLIMIRLEARDYERMEAAAEAQYLKLSTWARQVLLREVDAQERPARRRRH